MESLTGRFMLMFPVKAYRAGGFGLTLLTLGAILMLTAFFWNQPGPIRIHRCRRRCYSNFLYAGVCVRQGVSTRQASTGKRRR
jgi:hypothetical protein